MADKVTWTVEEIEEARRGKCIHDGCPDFPAVCPHECSSRSANMLRAFAAQTRQVEAMREWLKATRVSSDSGACSPDEAFAALFPKDGAQ